MEPIAPILLEIIYFADSSNFIIFIESAKTLSLTELILIYRETYPREFSLRLPIINAIASNLSFMDYFFFPRIDSVERIGRRLIDRIDRRRRRWRGGRGRVKSVARWNRKIDSKRMGAVRGLFVDRNWNRKFSNTRCDFDLYGGIANRSPCAKHGVPDARHGLSLRTKYSVACAHTEYILSRVPLYHLLLMDNKPVRVPRMPLEWNAPRMLPTCAALREIFPPDNFSPRFSSKITPFRNCSSILLIDYIKLHSRLSRIKILIDNLRQLFGFFFIT